MRALVRPLVAALLLVSTPLASAVAAQDRPICHDWDECRQFALKAYDARDYEAFYDFAHRTVVAGPPRDAKLMFMLARAQSLTGRVDDAIQMLGRLAQMGVATDASTSDDFEATRAAAGWPDLKATLDTLKPRLRLSSGAPQHARGGVIQPVQPAQPAQPAQPVQPAQPAQPAQPVEPVDTALRLPATTITPTGLAYDHVSGRFLLADRDGHKLVSVDEQSRHMVDLVKADSAGFREITAFEIDTKRGDLWVVSAGAPGGSDHEAATALHKLQLISGRPLARFEPGQSFDDARFDDLAVTGGGVVYVLDAPGARVFRLAPRGSALTLACRLRLDHPISLALAGDKVAYVAYAGGLARVNLSTGGAVKVSAPKVPLDGLERIRWDQGHIVGTQRLADGSRQVVSIKVVGGARPKATAVERLDSAGELAGGTLTALSGDDVYFLTKETGHDGQDGEFVVHRARLP